MPVADTIKVVETIAIWEPLQIFACILPDTWGVGPRLYTFCVVYLVNWRIWLRHAGNESISPSQQT
jgi:hypothetical protein